MQKIAIFTVVLFSFAACDLAKLEPAQTKAFMKYFGDDGNTEAADLLKLDDGYLLLGNNTKSGVTTALLIKVDLNGNLIWNSSFTNVKGSALAKTNDGYFFVGDRIDGDNPTSLSVIKVNLDGSEAAEELISEPNGSLHGTALTVSSIDEIIVCGYANYSSNPTTDSTFLYGYNSALVPTIPPWSVQKWGSTNVTRISSKTILENSSGNFVWTSLANIGGTNVLQALEASRDNSSLNDGEILLSNKTLTSDIGDFSYSSFGGAIAVQTVVSTNSAIALYTLTTSDEPALLEDSEKDLFAHAVVQASDGDYVVLGSTNKHADGTSRADLDFYITKVGIDGTVSSSTGFTEIIGGTGIETGAAIVQAEDKGFVFLGTMQNTNEVKLMVLVKMNNKGELIN